MVTINLKGRTVPLLYTTWETKQIQEELGPLNKAMDMVLARNHDDNDSINMRGSVEQLDAVAKLVRILGNAGLEEAGEAGDLTNKKVLRALKPAELPDAINACLDAMNEGMTSEIPEKEEEGPVDVTLEEMKKKKEMDG